MVLTTAFHPYHLGGLLSIWVYPRETNWLHIGKHPVRWLRLFEVLPLPRWVLGKAWVLGAIGNIRMCAHKHPTSETTNRGTLSDKRFLSHSQWVARGSLGETVWMPKHWHSSNISHNRVSWERWSLSCLASKIKHWLHFEDLNEHLN